MKRYILIFNNGQITQQDGLNTTYTYLLQIEVLKMVIDTKDGMIIKGEKWEWKPIEAYSDSNLVIIK